MDQTQLNLHKVTAQLPALSIEGSGEVPTTLPYPLLRQPGYSTSFQSLRDLIMKPFRLPNIIVDSSFTSWSLLISALQPTFHQWVPKLMENSVSPLFNINLTLMVPGHQFAVTKLAITYLPNMVGESHIFYPFAGNTSSDFSATSPLFKYNIISATNGIMFDIAPTSNTVKIKSSIPTNYPMNPADKSNLDANPLFGGFYLTNIVPLRFGMDLTQIVISPLINLTDVSFMPWR
nr:MAG: putative capsid protein 1 [Myotis brandtii picorna-like virus 1]